MARPTASVCLIYIVAILCHEVFAQSQECTHRYTTQPPRTADIDCNPYGNDATTLVLQCTVTIPEEDIVGSSIQWFHGDEVIQTDSVNQVSQSSRLTLSRLEESDMGEYYCLLVRGSIPRVQSDSLNLPSIDDLMPFNPCNPEDVYFREETKCATALLTPETTTKTTTTTTTGAPTSLPSSIPDNLFIITSTITQPDTTPLPNSTRNIETDTPPAKSSSSNETLRIWIYVLVAVAVVFGLFIIVLVIMYIRMYLKYARNPRPVNNNRSASQVVCDEITDNKRATEFSENLAYDPLTTSTQGRTTTVKAIELKENLAYGPVKSTSTDRTTTDVVVYEEPDQMVARTSDIQTRGNVAYGHLNTGKQ